MTTIVNTKLGENRGKKRIWLEGQKLAREGYEPGMRFDVALKDAEINVEICQEGRYSVSKRERNGRIYPIIDLNLAELAKIFDGVEMLRVAIKAGKIVITAHHQELRVKEREERLASKLSCGQSLDVCSLFHGGGLLDLALHQGLKQAGLKSRLAVAVEWEGKYLDASLTNNPELWDDESIVIESPVQSVNLAKNGLQVDLLVGGIPCTGSSLSGRSKNHLKHAESHVDAGAMFYSFLQFVEILNPSIVLIENVEEYQHTASMEVIRSVLSTLGYQLHEKVLNSNEFGTLERRKRLCVVGLSKGIKTFDFDTLQPLKVKEESINDILEDVPLDSDRWKSFDYLAEKEKRDIAAGKGFRRQLLDGSEPLCGTIGKSYAKCRSTEPFVKHPSDDSLSRLFTPLEHCRLKGAPEKVIANLSDTTAHEVLGQAIAFPVFKSVGLCIGQGLLRHSEQIKQPANLVNTTENCDVDPVSLSLFETEQSGQVSVIH